MKLFAIPFENDGFWRKLPVHTISRPMVLIQARSARQAIELLPGYLAESDHVSGRDESCAAVIASKALSPIEVRESSFWIDGYVADRLYDALAEELE